ncbi:MAG: HD domain-containing protein, partial [Oligoflexia bacterium]|nr:HD domain-containing protein [Oligoflexia bacterium]
KGIEHFYIKDEDIVIFSDYTGEILNQRLLDDNSKLSAEEVGNPKSLKNEVLRYTEGTIEIELDLLSWSHHLLDKFGISSMVVKNVYKIVDSCLLKIQRNQFIWEKSLFKIIKKKDFLAEHSLMIAYVASTLSHRIHWKIPESNLEKLTVAALFHDSGLEDSELAKIRDPIDVQSIHRSYPLDRKSIKKIYSHPYNAINLIHQSNLFIPDVENIVCSHHETPQGTGFPRKLNANTLNTLSCIFILSENFVEDLYAQGSISNIKESFLKRIQCDYNLGNFLAPMKEMQLLL